jgi:hypothetical protein
LLTSVAFTFSERHDSRSGDRFHKSPHAVVPHEKPAVMRDDDRRYSPSRTQIR